MQHNTTSPVWNEDFKFLVHVPGQQYLTGELKDWDRLSASDEIGRYVDACNDKNAFPASARCVQRQSCPFRKACFERAWYAVLLCVVYMYMSLFLTFVHL